MSAAIAMAPSPAPHDRPSFGTDLPPPTSTGSSSASTSTTSPSALRTATFPSAPAPPQVPAYSQSQQRTGSRSPKYALSAAAKSSPPTLSSTAGRPPSIYVKKEPSSPDLPAPRHRPRRLDLSKNANTNATSTGAARPMTARESGGLGIQEVGLACLSPGFVTQDPVMKEQLQRSISVREQQRHIIEARLQQQSAKGDGPDTSKDKDGVGFAAKTPGMSRRNKAPPGLSIVAPSHEQFAHERVIQSAPLGQTFTGRYNAQPLTRHITNQPTNLSSTSHIHHLPANQTQNRLPPISDVFGQGLSGHPDSRDHALYTGQNTHGASMASPSHPSHGQAPTPGRARDYKSAEEVQAEIAGGRPELLPKLVHYGGHQPPTPPSPPAGLRHSDATRSASKRRRNDYEEGGSPPLGHGRPAQRRGPFGEGRDSPETQRAKREEFLRLCERAWDLFHS